MEKQFKVGQSVIYVDQFGKPHEALVTVWWEHVEAYRSNTGMPGCNLVFVTSDPMKTDVYGFQIERETSVIHKTAQPAHGRYWCFRDEL